MTPVTPTPLPRLATLTPGKLVDIFALLHEKQPGKTRDNKPFFLCRFRDAKRSASCMIWADHDRYTECAEEWQVGSFFKLRVTYGEHKQYGPQLELHQIRPVNESDRQAGFSESDFLPFARIDPEKIFAELRQLACELLLTPGVQQLVLSIYDQHAAVLKRLPASPRHFYPYPGGWLEHTYHVAHNCLLLIDRYLPYHTDQTPPLNRELLLCAALLHEIGRVSELQLPENILEDPEPTISGRMLGHLLLGRDLVRQAIQQIPEFPPELALLLEHMLLSYLTLPEWGSPRLPMIPEVLILHHADDLDAKLEMYLRLLRSEATEGAFTVRDPVLGKALLKQRTL